MVDEIGVERDGSLEFSNGGVVPALEEQDISKRSASLWQAAVEMHSCLCQFKSAIERGGTEIIAIVRTEIGAQVGPRQHRGGARVIRVGRQGLFEQTACVVERGFRAPGQM